MSLLVNAQSSTDSGFVKFQDAAGNVTFVNKSDEISAEIDQTAQRARIITNSRYYEISLVGADSISVDLDTVFSLFFQDGDSVADAVAAIGKLFLKEGGGSTPTTPVRFGIEDATGVQDRAMLMGAFPIQVQCLSAPGGDFSQRFQGSGEIIDYAENQSVTGWTSTRLQSTEWKAESTGAAVGNSLLKVQKELVSSAIANAIGNIFMKLDAGGGVQPFFNLFVSNDAITKRVDFQIYDDGLSYVQTYDDIQNRIGTTNGGIQLRSRNLTDGTIANVDISPEGEVTIDAVKFYLFLPGATGAGYVLTDVAGDGELTLQPASGGGGGGSSKFGFLGQDDTATTDRNFNTTDAFYLQITNGNGLSLLFDGASNFIRQRAESLITGDTAQHDISSAGLTFQSDIIGQGNATFNAKGDSGIIASANDAAGTQTGQHQVTANGIIAVATDGTLIANSAQDKTQFQRELANPGTGSLAERLQSTEHRLTVADDTDTVKSVRTATKDAIEDNLTDGGFKTSVNVQGVDSFSKSVFSSAGSTTDVMTDLTHNLVSTDSTGDNESALRINANTGVRMQVNDVAANSLAIDLTSTSAAILKNGVSSFNIPQVNVPMDYADDTAAAAAGVGFGEFYHTAGVVKIRIS